MMLMMQTAKVIIAVTAKIRIPVEGEVSVIIEGIHTMNRPKIR